MRYTIDHDRRDGILVVRVEGEFCPESCRRRWREVAEACRLHSINSILLDVQAQTYPFSAEDAVEAFRKTPVEVEGALIAIVFPPEDAEFGVAALVVNHLTWNHGRYFHDETSARMWLALNRGSQDWMAA